jgi:hypothetical protein
MPLGVRIWSTAGGPTFQRTLLCLTARQGREKMLGPFWLPAEYTANAGDVHVSCPDEARVLARIQARETRLRSRYYQTVVVPATPRRSRLEAPGIRRAWG